MFKNYLITAYKVLLRRKFFTFVGLFGIALTLAVLLVVSTIIDNYLNPNGPEKHNDQFLVINKLVLKSKGGNNIASSRPGYYFLTANVARLKSPQKMSFYTRPQGVASYLTGEKLSNELRRTDIAYWDILDFDFIEGQPFDQAAFDAGAHQMVISETTAREYFGQSSALGKTIVIDQQRYTVVGVVADVSQLELEAFADMWVPYTTLPSTAYQQEIQDSWSGMIYHADPSQRAAMQQEFIHLLKNDFVRRDPERHHTAIAGADTPFEKMARQLANKRQYDSGANDVMLVLIALALAFMLLPSINLINLNISRIMERASEIGVRKAFGASSNQLVWQFIVENLLVTLLGGLIGFLLSAVVIYQIQANELLPMVDLSIRFNILLYGVVMVLVFGLLSGAYPAYKMSKLHPVNALKGGA